MRKKKREITFAERMQRLYMAGLKDSDALLPDPRKRTELEQLEREQRLEKLMQILHKNREMKTGYILTFIMYDIENNRIRRYISKYLEKKGYVRVQKSVFFGNVPRALHKQVCVTLKEVNEKYDNGDSLMFLPISIDMFNNLKVVGKNLSYELTVEQKSTLIF
ncbi:MAG: CRISPR-associated endonuclease Cas2 [Bacteroidales bacterium]|nr:CRISPR-associated endonuclease Cas2 [Bacteroidales bacterium]